MLELGYSFPTETSLCVPGVRNAADIWLEMFKAAKNTIDIEQLYISSPGHTVVDEYLSLIKGVTERGGAVKFIFDKKLFDENVLKGNVDYIRPVNELKKMPGVQIRFPRSDVVKRGAQHAKFFIIDKRLAWLGSHNFDWRSFEHIVEIGVKISNERLVGQLQTIFDEDWLPHKTNIGRENDAWCEVEYGEETHLAKIISSPDLRRPPLRSLDSFELSNILDGVNNARDTISIQLRNFSIKPRPPMTQEWTILSTALASAARRGVQVNMLLDSRVTNSLEQKQMLAILSSGSNFEIRVLTIPDSLVGKLPFARMLHAKMLVVDSALSWIGTGNWTPDDFLRSRNAGILVRGSKFARDLGEIFQTCWCSAYSSAIS
jgi:phosphatidylserine/phosphatidylglycerophosphate/cardiolipin synthase-like enzyme